MWLYITILYRSKLFRYKKDLFSACLHLRSGYHEILLNMAVCFLRECNVYLKYAAAFCSGRRVCL